jgi:hypothetical protein
MLQCRGSALRATTRHSAEATLGLAVKAARGREPLAALIKRDIAPWTPIIKAANVKGE